MRGSKFPGVEARLRHRGGPSAAPQPLPDDVDIGAAFRTALEAHRKRSDSLLSVLLLDGDGSSNHDSASPRDVVSSTWLVFAEWALGHIVGAVPRALRDGAGDAALADKGFLFESPEICKSLDTLCQVLPTGLSSLALC